MQDTEQQFAARLRHDDRDTRVHVRYASRFSLWLRFAEEKPTTEPKPFSKLIVDLDERAVETGPGWLLPCRNGEHSEFRVVPQESIHDFEKLLFRSKSEPLESVAGNLHLILNYKRNIDPRFAAFVSDLTFDLNSFKSVFDKIDKTIAEEPPEVRMLLQQGIMGSLGSNLMRYLDTQQDRLKEISRGYSEEENEHHGYYFRKQLQEIILLAPIMARTNLKPRGYIGDSEMMRMIYVNSYEGNSTFGKIIHKHAVAQPAAEAVRNRRGDMAEVIREFANRNIWTEQPQTEKLRVLSVACGPAMELNEILKSPEECDRLHFSLLDQDRQALLEAADTVSTLERRHSQSISADFVNESVRTMLVTRELRERWGEFNFIYSMGLFDYLTKPVAVALLRKLSSLLLPGGKMVIGNFSRDNPTAHYMAYWMDWPIIYRTENDMLELAAKIPGTEASVSRDDTGIQLLLHLEARRNDTNE